MLGLLKKMFGAKPVEATTEVPYKVEKPVIDTADIAIAQMQTSTQEVAGQAMIESVVSVKKAPVKKAPVKKAPVKKPATTSKPRKTKTKT